MATSTAKEILKRASTVNPETTLDVPPGDIAKHAKPAPGAAPHGSFAYLTAADGTEAWIVKGDQGQVVGYLRDASQPERAIEISDPAVWAKVVDSLGLTEHAVPLPPVEQAPPVDSAQDPTQPPADPAADPAAAPDAANPAAAPAPAPPHAAHHAAPPFQRKDGEPDDADAEGKTVHSFDPANHPRDNHGEFSHVPGSGAAHAAEHAAQAAGAVKPRAQDSTPADLADLGIDHRALTAIDKKIDKKNEQIASAQNANRMSRTRSMRELKLEDELRKLQEERGKITNGHQVILNPRTGAYRVLKPLPALNPEGKAASLDSSGSVAPVDDEEQTGIMVALIVPEGDAADLVLDHPTALPASQLHLTLAYLGTTEEVDDEGAYYADVLEALRDVAAEYDPVTANVSGVGRFSIPGDADAFYYSVDAPELPELRQAIVEALEENGLDVSREHGFTPHITVCYVKEGEDNPLRRAEPKVLNFDALVFCFGDQRLSIRLDGQDPEEDEAMVAPQLPGMAGYVDSTAPSAMPDKKAMPPQFRRGRNGKDKVGKRGGPPVAAGAWVSWGNQRGRVDLVVTDGKVPGVEEDITGTADKPAARVVVYTQGDGGKWKSTGKKVGVSAGSLKRSHPLSGGFGKKGLDDGLDPDGAVVGILTDYYEEIEGKECTAVDPVAVWEVYERGLVSWPGEHTGVANEAWALGRTKAFLTVAAGGEVKGYDADIDLLPAGHPQAVVNTGGPELVLAPEETEQVAEADSPAGDAPEEKALVTLDELLPPDLAASLGVKVRVSAGEEVLDRSAVESFLGGLRSHLNLS